MSRVIGVLSLLLFLAPPLARADYSPVAACPIGNLLAGKRPVAWVETRRELDLLTDETVSPEGSMWDAPVAVLLDTGASSVTWDLGAPTTVSALAVQWSVTSDC